MAPLRFLAKRSKLYAAFNRFAYQESEIRGLVDQVNCAPRPAEGLGLTGMDTLWHFVKTIKRYDFWTTTGMWGAIASAHQEVVELERRLAEFRVSSGACVGRRAEGSGERGPRVAEVAVDAGGGLQAELVWARALATWGLLMGLGKIYEEVCREWFLPTYLGVMTWSSVEGTEDESVADRILRQARSGAVDDERLLPAREAREGRLGRELEKLMASRAGTSWLRAEPMRLRRARLLRGGRRKSRWCARSQRGGARLSGLPPGGWRSSTPGSGGRWNIQRRVSGRKDGRLGVGGTRGSAAGDRVLYPSAPRNRSNKPYREPPGNVSCVSG